MRTPPFYTSQNPPSLPRINPTTRQIHLYATLYASVIPIHNRLFGIGLTDTTLSVWQKDKKIVPLLPETKKATTHNKEILS